MKTIETSKDLNEFLESNDSGSDYECLLRIYDNKSGILLQTVVVKHPVVFIRNIQDFCKNISLPVSDLSVQLIGYISIHNELFGIDEIVEISPYVYFKKPEESEKSEKSE